MTTLSRTELIGKLDDMIHASLKDYITADQPLAILDFPDIRNCGDSAIWLGEIEPYVEELFFDRKAEVDRFRWREVRARIQPQPTA